MGRGPGGGMEKPTVSRTLAPSAPRCLLGPGMLVHTVFFWLKAGLTEAQRADFRRGVATLASIASIEKAYIGPPAATEKRAVIDDTYSIALVVLCRNVAAHDAYQSDPIHLKFIADCRGYWDRVQVYDAECDG